jgi:hypothetical protein
MNSKQFKAQSNRAVDSVVDMADKAHANDVLGAYERGIVRGKLMAIQEYMDPDADHFAAVFAKVQALCLHAATAEHTTAMAKLGS